MVPRKLLKIVGFLRGSTVLGAVQSAN